MHAYEVHAYEVHAYEAHAYEMHAREVHSYERFCEDLAGQTSHTPVPASARVSALSYIWFMLSPMGFSHRFDVLKVSI